MNRGLCGCLQEAHVTAGRSLTDGLVTGNFSVFVSTASSGACFSSYGEEKGSFTKDK